MKCGIVGLPNVGKSTILNALAASNIAMSANYHFCTIEPNNAIVQVKDERLENLAKIAGSARIINAALEVVDIAGLISGASKGQGLGNKFLGHIREVDAIIHVLRAFNDQNIEHTYSNIDPLHDLEVVETELILADLESVENRIPTLSKQASQINNLQRSQQAKKELELMKAIYEVLKEGQPARVLVNKDNFADLKMLNLLTTKPIIYLCNVDEYGEDLILTQKLRDNKLNYLTFCARTEAELALIPEQDKAEYLSMSGLEHSSVDKIIRGVYNLLDMRTFFTVGPKEAHAWQFKSGSNAAKAAGVIHSDFEKGFICAETISYEDYIKFGTEAKAKEAGALRLEGRAYQVKDGDVIHFRFNV